MQRSRDKANGKQGASIAAPPPGAGRLLQPPGTKRHSKPAVVALAVVLALVGYLAFRLATDGPAVIAEEFRMRASNLSHAFKPKKIGYPINHVALLGKDGPPLGFALSMTGQYTVTVARSRADVEPMRPDVAVEKLAASLEALYSQAVQNEANAPRPADSRQKPPSRKNPPGTVLFGPERYDYTIHLPMLSSELNGGTEKQALERAAKLMVADLLDAQKPKPAPNPPKNPMQILNRPPIGFSVDFDGRHQEFLGGHWSIWFVPLDEKAIALQVKLCLRDSLLRDRSYREGPATKLGGEKVLESMPPFTTVTVHGPLDDVVTKIPTAPSPQYPTQEAIAQAAQKMVEGVAQRCEEQAKAINQGKKPRHPMVGGNRFLLNSRMVAHP
ncbi:MAG TPA: hypothetical protein VG944_18910 [Fimbriimonas sp.]|nr:hypothetical protein [Fimbriimonas sp.]